MAIQFSSWLELIDMGGHGIFVWTTVSVSLLIFLILVLLPVSAHSRTLKNVELNMEFEARSLQNADADK
ncbi:MAG: heme exporter protein CcmD [Porticoccaceae bacterium]|nr:heme exporter protein CcmD [Porticoccaceae bacterium]|tara:strand:- start:66315 stop:66521 length:207 start_codon:yes stop_codon:yes gene_type:complete